MEKTNTVSKTTTVVLKSRDYDAAIAALTPEQKKNVLAKSDSIKLNDINSIMNYGSEVSEMIAKNGDTLLSKVKADKSTEVVGYINDLLVQLGDFNDNLEDFSGESKNPIVKFLLSLPIIKRLKQTVDGICAQYSTVAENVDKISNKIYASKLIALRDNTTLQQIFETNEMYLNDLADLIMGAKLKLEEVNSKIEEAKAEGVESYEIQNMEYFKNGIEKRINDLQVTGHVFYQNLFQIMAMQQNNNAIAAKSDEIVNHVIPIWKNQLPIAIMMKNQTESVKAHEKIAKTTNALLEKTANDLKTNSIAIAKSSEETVISIQTLDKTTRALIETVEGVKKVHEDASKNRATIEATLRDLSTKIENAIVK